MFSYSPFSVTDRHSGSACGGYYHRLHGGLWIDRSQCKYCMLQSALRSVPYFSTPFLELQVLLLFSHLSSLLTRCFAKSVAVQKVGATPRLSSAQVSPAPLPAILRRRCQCYDRRPRYVQYCLLWLRSGRHTPSSYCL